MTSPESDNPHLADELLIVRHSGEIPEVALHGSLHFLTVAEEGPGLTLAEGEILALKGMVVERYREIICRDLTPANRDKAMYRGLARAACNWRRLEKFCRRESFPLAELQCSVGRELLAFLEVEVAEVAAGLRRSSLNCPVGEVLAFCKLVGLDHTELPEGWEGVCC